MPRSSQLLLASAVALLLPWPGLVQAQAALEERGPIRIASNLDFHALNGVRSGQGTLDDPYRIEGWRIQPATVGSDHACAVCILDTDRYVVVRDLIIDELPGAERWSTGVLLDNAQHVRLENNLIQDADVGYRADPGTQDIRLEGNRIQGNACGFRNAPTTSHVVVNNWFENDANACNDDRTDNPNTFGLPPHPGANIAGGTLLAGNYWSDYYGQDDENDRIGEEPYLIQHLSDGRALVDPYPLLRVPKPQPSVDLFVAERREFYAPYHATLQAVARDDSRITAYTWEFGDGSPPVQTQTPTMEHEFATRDPVFVRVRITDTADFSIPSIPILLEGALPELPHVELAPVLYAHEATCTTPSYSAPCIQYSPAPLEGGRPFAAALNLGLRDAHGDDRAEVRIEWGDGATSMYRLPDQRLPGGAPACNQRHLPSCLALAHTYQDKGTFRVLATVTSVNGLSSTADLTVRVTNAPPIIDQVVVVYNSGRQHAPDGRMPRDADAPEAVHVRALAHDPDGYIDSYEWSLPDGQTAHGPSVAFVEPERRGDPAYVRLRIRDNDGAETTRAVPALSLEPDPNNPTVPTLEGLDWDPKPVRIDEPARFAVSAQDPDGISAILWDMGDGTIHHGNPITHTYREPGDYDIRAIAIDAHTDPDARVAAQTRSSVHVEGDAFRVRNPHNVLIVVRPAPEGPVPLEVELRALARVDADPDAQTWWDFGDGSQARATNPHHVYARPGLHHPSVAYVDRNGRVSHASATVNVTGGEPMTLGIRAEASGTTAPATVRFYADVAHAKNQTLRYEWTFGDGQTSALPEPTHAYLRGGRYDVRLVVHGDWERAEAAHVLDLGADPHPPFLIELLRHPSGAGRPPFHVTFTAIATPYRSAPIHDSWDFGDDTHGDGPITSHTYTEYGSYLVLHTATDEQGQTETGTLRVDLVTGLLIGTDQDLGLVQRPIRFWYTLPLLPGQETHWAFGDGATAHGTEASHAYERPGRYNVSLTITGPETETSDWTRVAIALNHDSNEIHRVIPAPDVALVFLVIAPWLRRRRP